MARGVNRWATAMIEFGLFLIGLKLGFVFGGLTENCLTWAARQYLANGGCLLCRRSTFADDTLPERHRKGFGYWLAKRVPHFLWRTPEGSILQYTVTPEGRQVEQQQGSGLFRSWLRIWFYDGHVVAGDTHDGGYWEICR